MKLSEQIKNCLDGSGCKDCEHHEADTKFICRGLLEKAYERIKGYEELEEQCIKENSWCLRMLLHKWREFFEDIHELYEYRKLEERGELLKLPCAVGDSVYTLNPLPSGKTVIAETTADAFFCALCALENRFGKTVFLAKSEAESALKEMSK